MEKKIYICPMHPEVRRDNPGRCPKCGMDLVAVAPRGKDLVKQTERTTGSCGCC